MVVAKMKTVSWVCQFFPLLSSFIIGEQNLFGSSVPSIKLSSSQSARTCIREGGPAEEEEAPETKCDSSIVRQLMLSAWVDRRMDGWLKCIIYNDTNPQLLLDGQL